jgi:hypothetical protein
MVVLSVSQIRTLRSFEPEATHLPSGEMEMEKTASYSMKEGLGESDSYDTWNRTDEPCALRILAQAEAVLHS